MVCLIPSGKSAKAKQIGFTLIELLVVLTILAVLITIAYPTYFNRLDRSKETLLKQELQTVRESIDRFYADEGRFPETLDELVEKKYINKLPYDPITEKNDTWTTTPPEEGYEGNVADLHSGAGEVASDGSQYDSW